MALFYLHKGGNVFILLVYLSVNTITQKVVDDDVDEMGGIRIGTRNNWLGFGSICILS